MLATVDDADYGVHVVIHMIQSIVDNPEEGVTVDRMREIMVKSCIHIHWFREKITVEIPSLTDTKDVRTTKDLEPIVDKWSTESFQKP